MAREHLRYMYWDPADKRWYQEDAPGRSKFVCAIFHRYVRVLGYGAMQTAEEREQLAADPTGQAAMNEFATAQARGDLDGKSFQARNEQCAHYEAYVIEHHPNTAEGKILVRMRDLEEGLQLPAFSVAPLMAYVQIIMLPTDEDLNGIQGRGLSYPSVKKVVGALSGYVEH